MPTGQAIELSYARQLVQNYMNRGFSNETEAVWFSKEIILTALGLDPATPTNNISGLRFYFGSYKNEPGYPANEYDQDKLTLVMVQTGIEKIEIERHGDKEVAYLDIIDEPDPTKKTQPSYPDPTNPTGNTLHTFNDSQLCPPPPYGSGLLGLHNW